MILIMLIYNNKYFMSTIMLKNVKKYKKTLAMYKNNNKHLEM